MKNESVDTWSNAKLVVEFFNSDKKHFTRFFRPKRFSAIAYDNICEIKPASGSFTLQIDVVNKIVYTTGKPEYPESVSYTEMIELIKGGRGRNGFVIKPM